MSHGKATEKNKNIRVLPRISRFLERHSLVKKKHICREINKLSWKLMENRMKGLMNKIKDSSCLFARLQSRITIRIMRSLTYQ